MFGKFLTSFIPKGQGPGEFQYLSDYRIDDQDRILITDPFNNKLVIYNTIGKVVNELVNQNQQAGSYSVTWDGRSQNGTHVSTGMYFYEINTEEFSQVKKMILSR